MRLSRLSTVTAVLLAGCLGAITVVFNVEEPVPEQTVPGDPLQELLGDGDFDPVGMDVTMEQEYQQEEFDYVKTLELTALSFSITADSTNPSVDTLEDGQPDDFSFIDQIDVVIQANIGGTDQSEVIAYLNSGDPQLDPGNSTINLTTTGVNILDYMEAPGGYTIEIQATGNLPPDDVIFDGLATYRVTAGLNQ